MSGKHCWHREPAASTAGTEVCCLCGAGRVASPGLKVGHGGYLPVPMTYTYPTGTDPWGCTKSKEEPNHGSPEQIDLAID